MKLIKIPLLKVIILCASVFALNASAQTFSVKSIDWQAYSETYEVSAKYLQTAVSDGAIFALPAPTEIGDMHPDLQYCTKGYKIINQAQM